MKRPIEFRGLYKNVIVYGNLITRTIKGKTDYLIENCDFDEFRQYEVEPDSIGQYTGLKDVSAAKIYEKDAIKHEGIIYRVLYADAMFSGYTQSGSEKPLWELAAKGELVGNFSLDIDTLEN